MYYRELSAPISVQWELTSWCNHRCLYCYNYWRERSAASSPSSVINYKLFEKTVDELIKNKVFHVTLTGGEPLGIIEKIPHVLYPLKEAGISLGINTNLSMISMEKVKVLKELGIKKILVSLQSSEKKLNDTIAQTPGAFEQTLEGINLAINNNFIVSINMVVIKQNLHSVRDTGKLAAELGAHAFCATKASMPPNCKDFNEYELNSEELSQMLLDLLWINNTFGISVDSLEHYPACAFPNDETRTFFGSRTCSAGRTSCTVGFDGHIRPCSHASETYGSITDGLVSAWENMKEWRNNSLIPLVCQNECKAYPFNCGGGCRVDAQIKTGNLAESDWFSKKSKPKTKKYPKKLTDIDADTEVILEKEIKIRPEDFGYILFRSPSRWLPIDNNLHSVIISASKEQTRTPLDISNACKIDMIKAKQIIQILISKKLVEKI